MHFFGRIGFVSIFFSGVVFLWSLYLRIFIGTHFSRTPLPVLIAILLVLGVTLILLGLVAEMILRVSYNDKKLYEVAEKYDGTA
jgi:hypothetical protein